MNATRCGSYPLMNIAQDFGVDYGDVLLVHDALREIATRARAEASIEAGGRIRAALGADAARALLERLHRVSRWRDA
jgi:hypothetical protein